MVIETNHITFIIEHYEEFVKGLPKNIQQNVLIFVGNSGQGKSTLLARCLCNLNCEDFMNSLPKKGKVVEREGIKIGNLPRSTTIVPNWSKLDFGDLGTVDAVDVAGFKALSLKLLDTIQILHLCTLKKIQKPSFVFVISIEHILKAVDDRTFLQLIESDYHMQVKSLCGDQYTDVLENSFFVFTHGDALTEKEKSELNLSQLIQTVLMPSAIMYSRDQDVTQFYKAMSQRHVIVDYETQNREFIMRSLGKCFQKIKTKEILFDFSGFVGHINKLNASIVQKFDEIFKDFSNEVGKLQNEKERSLEKLKQLVIQHEAITKNLQVQRKELSMMKKDEKKMKKKLKSSEHKLVIAGSFEKERKMKLELEGGNHQIQEIQKQGKKRWEVLSFFSAGGKVEIRLPNDLEINEDMILAVQQDEKNDSEQFLSRVLNIELNALPQDLEKQIKKFVPHPPVMKKVKNFVEPLPLVLKKGKLNQDGFYFRRKTDLSQKFVFKYGKKTFRVFIFYQKEMKSDLDFIREEFTRKLKKVEKDIKKREEVCVELKSEIDSLKGALKKNKTSQRQTNGELKKSKSELRKKEEEIEYSHSNMIETMKKNIQRLIQMSEKKDVKSIQQMGEIFKEIGIKSNIIGKLGKFSFKNKDAKDEFERSQMTLFEDQSFFYPGMSLKKNTTSTKVDHHHHKSGEEDEGEEEGSENDEDFSDDERMYYPDENVGLKVKDEMKLL